MVADILCGRSFEWPDFFADLEVKVDQLVGKGGKLVGEASLVLSRLRGVPGERIVLLLDLLVQLTIPRVQDHHVHVVLATRYNLS